MRIALYEPPEALRVGGLDLAIRTLEGYLKGAGVEVYVNPARAELATLRPDVVHLHGLWQRSFSRVAAWCRANGVPYMMSPHGMLEPWAFQHKGWKKRPYFYLFERRLMRSAARLIATGDQEAANLSRYTGREDVEVIPLALSSDRLPDYAAARAALGWEDGERVLVYLSRVHPKKGLHLLLDALLALRKELEEQQLRLVIVGEGEAAYVRTLTAQADQLEGVCRIEWPGGVWGEEKWRYLQGADLFCLPTFSENFGLAVQEACQVGTPVLTTHTTPWGFLNEWGGGFVVDPTVEEIGGALRRFLGGFSWAEADRERLARRTRERFDPDVIGQRYIEAYELAISN